MLKLKSLKYYDLCVKKNKQKKTTKVYLKPSLNGFFSEAKPVKNFTNKNLVTQKITYECTICVNNNFMKYDLNVLI